MGKSFLIADHTSSLVIRLVLILNGVFISAAQLNGLMSKIHIVHLGAKQHDTPELVTKSHYQILEPLLGSKEAAKNSIVYNYKHGFSGFAAKLTASQAKNLSVHPEVLSVVPSRVMWPKTTRTYDYLGLSPTSPKGLLHDTKLGSEVIIGVIDSGIWPESHSFNDTGLGPIPKRWKGKCMSGDGFDPKKHCNKKLIGAEFFTEGLLNSEAEYDFESEREFRSPRDAKGHGTHVAATAAGSFVSNASYKGLAVGTARGAAPHARIAMYKTCWRRAGCITADLLKAIDHSIRDGVDVISVSIGNDPPASFDVDMDDIAFGSFQAVMKGIPVVASAGNEGPDAQTIDNVAPWIITVAATSFDRSFPVPITLGNNLTVLAEGLNTFPEVGFIELQNAIELLDTNIEEGVTKGSIVLAFTATATAAKKAHDILEAGCAGIIYAQSVINPTVCNGVDVPCAVVDYEYATDILHYIQTSDSPKAKISPSKTLIGQPLASRVAYFSSRGPNSVTPAILKPDIAAPGVNVLSAVSGVYTILSGSSMATPIVSGIVGLLRQIHPGWSPAAIRSALVTTAWRTDPSGEQIFSEGSTRKLADPFDYGGGLINPEKVANPGLIYDMGINDYVHYLCSAEYDDGSISKLLGKPIKCPYPLPSMLDFNMPSIIIPSLTREVTLTRTVTNVGPADSVYKPLVESPLGIELDVNPKTLVFASNITKGTFNVRVKTSHRVNSDYYFGSLCWTDGVHNVTIPIAVRTKILKSYD
ncbi:PREDICTED: subtilisin-like protease SBT3.17 [Camelina sativa]|uniref:Subtilisin-like protease SBT3.17 n=1 Tax=Camelina sativa TaxID=90675 RepID=A0ABM0WPE4_CAMSA|nr:PREDICTED: subtilisin-like protease SBT3.17 [Camelina sativa]